MPEYQEYMSDSCFKDYLSFKFDYFRQLNSYHAGNKKPYRKYLVTSRPVI